METTDSNCCSQSNDWPTSYILALLPCYVAKIANKTLLSNIKMETVSEGYALFRIYNKVTPIYVFPLNTYCWVRAIQRKKQFCLHSALLFVIYWKSVDYACRYRLHLSTLLSALVCTFCILMRAFMQAWWNGDRIAASIVMGGRKYSYGS